MWSYDCPSLSLYLCVPVCMHACMCLLKVQKTDTGAQNLHACIKKTSCRIYDVIKLVHKNIGHKNVKHLSSYWTEMYPNDQRFLHFKFSSLRPSTQKHDCNNPTYTGMWHCRKQRKSGPCQPAPWHCRRQGHSCC